MAEFSEDQCYVCKLPARPRHEFYARMCESCGALNYVKRMERADLTGYVVLVTGVRIKIGFETCLRLLRNGATIIGTTRFPRAAARRFSREDDFEQWHDRLSIYGLDLRHIASVEEFISDLRRTLPKLDMIINNAAQTVRRPPLFYRELAEAEAEMTDDSGETMRLIRTIEAVPQLLASEPRVGELVQASDPMAFLSRAPQSGLSAALSQIPLLPGDEATESIYFPAGQYDRHEQQEDRRPFNSWMMKLVDVPWIEFLEVFLINVAAPFLFNSRLRPLLEAGSGPSFIINVTAMEGNFYAPEKSVRHPHTNMAKAALNMMTRTCAEEYAQARIYMNSVDVGWITNEKPYPLDMPEDERREVMAIDELDGAARICDPIFRGVKGEALIYGRLLKNFEDYPW